MLASPGATDASATQARESVQGLRGARLGDGFEGDGPARLELGGAPGVKDFLRAEFAAFGSTKLVSPASLVRGR